MVNKKTTSKVANLTAIMFHCDYVSLLFVFTVINFHPHYSMACDNQTCSVQLIVSIFRHNNSFEAGIANAISRFD